MERDLAFSRKTVRSVRGPVRGVPSRKTRISSWGEPNCRAIRWEVFIITSSVLSRPPEELLLPCWISIIMAREMAASSRRELSRAFSTDRLKLWLICMYTDTGRMSRISSSIPQTICFLIHPP